MLTFHVQFCEPVAEALAIVAENEGLLMPDGVQTVPTNGTVWDVQVKVPKVMLVKRPETDMVPEQVIVAVPV